MSLQFHTRIPHGNGVRLRVDRKDDATVVVFSPEARGGADALWFCFRLVEKEPEVPHPVKVEIVMEYATGLFGCEDVSQIRPVFQASGQPWCRVSGSAPAVEKDGQVSVSWRIPYPEDETLFALCYPYAREDLAHCLKKCRGYWEQRTIGLSQRGRKIIRLSNGVGSTSHPSKGIYVIAREHGGECSTSWLADGLLEGFARTKKNPLTVWCVPFASPDSIANGDFGRANPMVGPDGMWGDAPGSLNGRVIKADLVRWAERAKPLCVVNLVGAGGGDNRGLSMTLPPETEGIDHKALKSWSNFLADALGECAAPDFASAPVDASSARTNAALRAYVAAELSCPLLTLNVPYAACGKLSLTRKQYREAGQRLASALIRKSRN